MKLLRKKFLMQQNKRTRRKQEIYEINFSVCSFLPTPPIYRSHTDPPVVIVKPDNLTINETGEFLLFCEYDANPASLISIRWLQNNSVLNLNQSRFDGGNPEQTALLVKNATRDDRGTYSCELTNQVGTGMSENGVDVDVQCKRERCSFRQTDFNKHIFLVHR